MNIICNNCTLYTLNTQTHTHTVKHHYIKVWLFGYLCFTSLQQRGHAYLLSLVKDVKLGKYTIPTGNRTPGRRVTVHYITAAPLQLRSILKTIGYNTILDIGL